MSTPIRDTATDIWVDAEVWVSLEDAPQIDTATEELFGAEWDLVGLLSGSDGFAQSREFSTTSAEAWGKGEVDGADYGFRSTGGFTALEDTNVVRYMINPGSTEHVIVVPKPSHVHLAYVATNQRGEKEILLTRKKARVFAPDVSKTQEFAGTAFEVTHYADSIGALFDRVYIDSADNVHTYAPIRIKGLTTPETPLDTKGIAVTPPPTGV